MVTVKDCHMERGTPHHLKRRRMRGIEMSALVVGKGKGSPFACPVVNEPR